MVSTIPASSIAASAPRWRYGSLRSAVTTTTPTSLTTPTTTPTTTKTTTKTTPAIPTATMPIGTTTPTSPPIATPSTPAQYGHPHNRPPPPSDGLPNYGSRHGPAHRKSSLPVHGFGPTRSPSKHISPFVLLSYPLCGRWPQGMRHASAPGQSATIFFFQKKKMVGGRFLPPVAQTHAFSRFFARGVRKQPVCFTVFRGVRSSGMSAWHYQKTTRFTCFCGSRGSPERRKWPVNFG